MVENLFLFLTFVYANEGNNCLDKCHQTLKECMMPVVVNVDKNVSSSWIKSGNLPTDIQRQLYAKNNNEEKYSIKSFGSSVKIAGLKNSKEILSIEKNTFAHQCEHDFNLCRNKCRPRIDSIKNDK